jgi:hypothetical protein
MRRAHEPSRHEVGLVEDERPVFAVLLREEREHARAGVHDAPHAADRAVPPPTITMLPVIANRPARRGLAGSLTSTTSPELA